MQILKNSSFLSQEMEDKEIFVLAGPNGVGKTEIALNLTSFFRSLGLDSYLLDLDFTKADFTARSERFLSQVSILPGGKGKYADTPLWDKEIPEVLSQINKTHRLVVYLGGELKVMKLVLSVEPFWKKIQVHLTLVTNFCRPFSEEEFYFDFMERANTTLNLEFHSVISNTHLIEYTDGEILKMGWQKAGDFSQKENLPIFFVSIWEDLIENLSWNIFDSAVVGIRRFLHLPWIK